MSSKMKNLDEAAELDEAKSLALEMFLDVWEAALEENIDPDVIASIAIFAALTDMVENHGEELAAQMAEGLPARIRAGEFTLAQSTE
jgi:hypothetical protein